MTTEEKVRTLRRRSSRLTVDKLLRESFNKIDTDQDGEINALDLRQGLLKAGVNVTVDDTIALLNKMDHQNLGKITFHDFHTLHGRFIKQIFATCDHEGKGYLDQHSIQQGLTKLGISVTTAEAKEMMDTLRPKEEDKLRPEEFHQLYLLLRAQMYDSPVFEALLWDPDVRELSKQWWRASIEVGEGGLRMPIPTQEKKKIDPSVRFFGGALSGVIEALCLTPLDVTKTRLQLDKSGRYTGMLDCAKKLYGAEDAVGLYKGFTPWTAHVVLKNGCRFYFNAIYRRLLSDADGQVSGSKEFLAGAMAGATEAILIVTPFEVVKTRLQGQDSRPGKELKYRGTFHTTYKIIQTEGPFALWKGVAPTIARQGLNQACSFWTNTFIKKNIWELKEGETLAPWKSAITGMVGAIPGPCLNCPMDVIKTRLMNQSNARGEAPKYRGVIHALQVIPKEEGIGALYKGLLPRLSRLCPSYGIQWVVMDQVTAYFSK